MTGLVSVSRRDLGGGERGFAAGLNQGNSRADTSDVFVARPLGLFRLGAFPTAKPQTTEVTDTDPRTISVTNPQLET